MNYINYTKICIMCPTFGRADTKLKSFIQSLLEHTEDYGSICLCFIVNKEDVESVIAINNLCGAEVEFEIIYEETKECNLSHYFNLAYNGTTFNSPGTCVSMFGDDMVFVTQGWEEMVLEKINDLFGYGLVYGDDDYCQHENLCVYFVTTRELVEITGKPFMCESIAVDFIDNIWMDFASKMHCAAYLPSLHIRHEHVARDGKPDSVWLRMRTQFDKSHKSYIEMSAYVDEMVANAREKLQSYITPDISFCMTTFDRIGLFQQTVLSWNKCFLIPDKLFVFDDGSNDTAGICRAVYIMKNACSVIDKTHMGCNRRNAQVITSFMTPAVMVIDSDTAFSSHWFIAVLMAWNQIKERSDIAGVTLFNANGHEPLTEYCNMNGLCYKKTVGGFGTLYKTSIISEIFKNIAIDNFQENWSWDNYINDWVKKNGLRYGCTAKSYLQHTGYIDGTHVSDSEFADFATDYIGEIEYAEPPRNTPMPSGSYVLIAAMARLGDIIAASMIINMIINKGFNVSLLVIMIYEKIARRLCPNAKIISVEPVTGGPYGEWSETTTIQMRQKYPSYSTYINIQIGARENHQSYVTSGKHPCVWMRDQCNNALGVDLGGDFKSFLFFNKTGIPFNDRNVKVPERLAIISKETKTTIPFPDEMFTSIFDALKNEGYSPRYLVKTRPQNLATKKIREEYIYGLTVEQCILLLMKASYFVGQDSGLSWCALFSNCCKKIYHHKDRIQSVNTLFNQIDPTAEDIIMGD